MYIVLVVLAILVVIAGGLMLTQATMGVGVIAFAIFLIALARVVQAERHHAQPLGTRE